MQDAPTHRTDEKYTNKNKKTSEEEDMTDDEATVTGRSQNQKRQQARVLDTTITAAFLSKMTLTTKHE